jgi:hypothetical protein
MNPDDKAKVETDGKTAELSDAELDAVNGGLAGISAPAATVSPLAAARNGGGNAGTGGSYLSYDLVNVLVTPLQWGHD